MHRVLILISWHTLTVSAWAATPLPLHEGRDAYTPCAAFGAGQYLVAWQSGRTAPGDLREGLTFHGDLVACRVDSGGKPLDAQPFVVCQAPDLQENPRAAFGGGVFLLVWHDARNGKDWDVYAARVSPEGKVLDPDGVLVAGGAHNQALPRVAWDGKSFVVVWQDMRSGSLYEVYAARIGSDGKVLDPGGVKLASGEWYHCHGPAVASAGDGRSMVLFLGFAPFAGNAFKTPHAAVQFVRDGKPEGEPIKAQSKEREGGPGGRGHPVVLAAGKECFLAAWKTDASLGRGFGPAGGSAALFDAAGIRGQEIGLGQASGQKRIVNPDVAWDGKAFVATWHEFVTDKKGDCPADAVFAAHVGPEGTLSGARRLAGSLATPASEACVATDGAGNALVAYEQHPASGEAPIHIAVEMLKAP